MFHKIEDLFINPKSNLNAILKTIQNSGIGIALVVDSKKVLLGTITDGDVRRALMKYNNPSDLKSEDIMNSKPLVASMDMTKREMLLLLKNKKRQQLPIVNTTGKVIDIIWMSKLLEEIDDIVIPLSEPDITQLEIKYVSETIKSSWISTAGLNVSVFKEKLQEYFNNRKIIMTNTGTAALHTLLLSFGIGKGDEVILPSLTFIATANAVAYTGAKPVFADVDKFSWNIDVNNLEKLITKKTKAIIAVHLLGNPVDFDRLIEIAKKNNLYVFEDAAQAFGARYKGKLCGNLGDGGVISFNGNKIITSGGGGAIILKDKKSFEIARALVNQGRFSNRKYYHKIIGYNYKMTNLHAAVGIAQFERKRELFRKRKNNFHLYRKCLSSIKGIKFQKISNDSKPNFWITAISIDNNKFGITADELFEILKTKGIMVEKMYPPIISNPPYENFSKKENLSNSFSVADSTIFLPSSSNLKEDDIKFICKTIKEADIK